MVTIRHLTVEQAKKCMENREFTPDIIQSKPYVAVVLTQSWCPQWQIMNMYLKEMVDVDLDIWVFLYDQSSIFTQFMTFKETVFKNDQIPYIRYYHNGILINESNLAEPLEFMQNFDKASPIST